MSVSDYFEPWVDHDGNGCPASIVGKFVLIESKLSQHDQEGGDPGQIGAHEVLLSETIASLPDWHDDNYGKVLPCPIRGVPYGVSKILRYRVRKPRALCDLIELVANLPELERTEA